MAATAESAALEALLAQAKKGGDWNNYSTLLQAPALTANALNAVPTGRQFGVIHQLAYWGAVDPLKETLAKFPSLNLELKTSKGQTPVQVAQERSHATFVDFIQGWAFMQNLGNNTANTTNNTNATQEVTKAVANMSVGPSDSKTGTFAAPSAAVSGGFTFTVEPGIKPGGKYGYSAKLKEPDKSDTLEQAWKKMATAKGSIEAMSLPPERTVAVFSKQNMFAKSVHSAFYGHYPLVISPDVIWLTIAQGLANHVDQNAEQLRKEFVNHQGKKDLCISRANFVKGSPKNDWPGVFPEFSALIKENSVAGTTELLENDFTTTGPVERIVSHITLMDAVQHYFSYSMCCGCGFPSITLTGTPADWEKIRNKAAGFTKYGLDWWLKALLPALDQFVLASKGSPDLDFWRSLCNINVGTSFPIYEPLTGWVQVFFPYLLKPGSDFDSFAEAKDGVAKKSLQKNNNLANYVEGYKAKVNMGNWKVDGKGMGSKPPPGGQGVKLELFPPGMSSAPFTYKDLSTNKKHKMAFFGGVTCLVQHASGAIEPKCGWAVLDSGELIP